MNKKIIIFAIIILELFNVFSQDNSRIKFIKGNISDKTAAVRQATGEDAHWLTQQAIDFILENKEYLGNDRDLDGLAVAAIFSISSDNLQTATQSTKDNIVEQLTKLFISFDKSSTVQIAIISKVLQIKDVVSVRLFTELLNNNLANIVISTADPSVVKASISALEDIGNNESFLILYNNYKNPKFKNYEDEILSALTNLVPVSSNEILAIIKGNPEQIIKLFPIINNSKGISKRFLCEIAENILNESIILLDNSNKRELEELTKIQNDAILLLSENKWTRASATAINFFKNAKERYNNNKISDEYFINIISSLNTIAPVEAVEPLTKYLEELNSKTESGNQPNSNVVFAVIKTLGAIGDKAAFDSLLAVTYLGYPENILSAARDALSGLRW